MSATMPRFLSDGVLPLQLAARRSSALGSEMGFGEAEGASEHRNAEFASRQDKERDHEQSRDVLKQREIPPVNEPERVRFEIVGWDEV